MRGKLHHIISTKAPSNYSNDDPPRKKKSGAQRPITYHRTAATDAVAGRHAKDDKQTPIMSKRMSHAKPPLAKFTIILSEVLLKRSSANNAAETAQNKRLGR